MTKVIEVRSLPAEFRDLDTSDDVMKVSGILNIPNAQSAPLNGKDGNAFIETIQPQAFAQAITNALQIDLLAMHDPSLLLASTDNDSLDLTQNGDGNIQIDATLANTQPAKDTYAMIQDGLMGGLSFGMYVNNCTWGVADDGVTPLRTITDLDIFEVSIVRHPAYESTTIETRNISGTKNIDVPSISKIKEEKTLSNKKDKELEKRSKDEDKIDDKSDVENQKKTDDKPSDVQSQKGTSEKNDDNKKSEPTDDDKSSKSDEKSLNSDDKSKQKDDVQDKPSDDNSELDNPGSDVTDDTEHRSKDAKTSKVAEKRDDSGAPTVEPNVQSNVASLQDVFNAAYSAISCYNSWSPFNPGDTVEILVNHDGATNMKGAQGVVEAVNGNAYIVGYQPTDGSTFVEGYRWFTADELRYTFVDVTDINVTDSDSDGVDVDPYSEYRSKDNPLPKANFENIEKAKIALKQHSNKALLNFFKK